MNNGSLTPRGNPRGRRVCARTSSVPCRAVGIILGSGLSPLAEQVEETDLHPLRTRSRIFAISTVPGHAGRLVVGQLAGQTVIVMQGAGALL